MELRIAGFLLVHTMMTMSILSRHSPACSALFFSARSSTARNNASKRTLKNQQHGRHHAPSQYSRIFTRLASSETIENADHAESSSSSSSLSPYRYTKSYRLDGVGVGSRVDITTNTGHALATDVPRKMGGKDSAPQPVETLLAAWMGCTQATAMFVARQLRSVEHPRGIRIERLEFDTIEGFRDERGALELPIDVSPVVPSRLQRITGTVRVVTTSSSDRRQSSGGPLSEQQLHTLKEQTEARCPVANMILSSGCAIDVVWISVTMH